MFIQRKPKEALNIVIEFDDFEYLNQKIEKKQKEKNPFPEPEILDYIFQICLALKYLHEKKIIYRYLNSGNVFLMKNGIIKLGFFGSRFEKRPKLEIKSFCKINKIGYLSPEIISCEPYDVKSDIWSLGVLLYELMTFKLPINETNPSMLIIKINRRVYPPPPSTYSSEIRDLLKKCLTLNPKERPSINDILHLLKSKIYNILIELKYDQDLYQKMAQIYEDKKRETKNNKEEEKKEKNEANKKLNDKEKIKKELNKTNFLIPKNDMLTPQSQGSVLNFQMVKQYKEEEIGKILKANGITDFLDEKNDNFDVNKMNEDQYNQLRLLNILYNFANNLDQDSNKEILSTSSALPK